MVRLLAACVAAESGSVEVLPALRVVASELADEEDRQVVLVTIDRLQGGAAPMAELEPAVWPSGCCA
jgi:hypothetical protein